MAPGLSARLLKRHGAFGLDLSLALAPGVTALVGPSGSGKTTTIRCLAGLERPDDGRIALGEAIWYDAAAKTHWPPQSRRVGFVFQDYALFPHLTVAENVAFGARNTLKVTEALERLGIGELAARRPRTLSAGQQQRVALARAIASEPQLLLLDEPFSSLDAALKERLYGEFARLLSQLVIPVVIVTHDLREASLLADTMVVLDGGRCLQTASPQDVFFRPAGPVVAELAGIPNTFEGHLSPEGLVWGPYTLSGPTGPSDGRQVGWCVRPEHVAVLKAPSEASNEVPARLLEVALAGPRYRVRAEVGGLGIVEASIEAPLTGPLELRPGDSVWLRLGAVHVFSDL